MAGLYACRQKVSFSTAIDSWWDGTINLNIIKNKPIVSAPSNLLLKHIWKSVQSSEDKIPLMQISATIRVVKI